MGARARIHRMFKILFAAGVVGTLPAMWLTARPPRDPHRRQLQNGVTRAETREFFRILFHDKSRVTDAMVDEQLAMRLRSAFAISKMQEAGEKGLGVLTEDDVRGVKAPTLIVWG